MEKQLDAKIKKEKLKKLQSRRSEFKRVNLSAKVLRYEEARNIQSNYKKSVQEEDDRFFESIKAAKVQEQLKAQEEKKTAAKLLEKARAHLDTWRNTKIQERKTLVEDKRKTAEIKHLREETRRAIELAFKKYTAVVEEDDDKVYEEYERITDIIRVDSNISRDDFKRTGESQ